VSLVQVMLVSQGVGFVLLAAVLLIAGSAPPGLTRLLPAAAGGIAGLAALAAFYRGLAIGTMSIVAPISATGVAVPVIVGLAGGDRPHPLQIAGIFAAVIGVVLASREEPTLSAPDRRVARTSVLLALVAAAGFGSFFVGMRISARADVLWALFAARVMDVCVLTALAITLGRRGVAWVGNPRAQLPLVAAGVLDLLANALYAIASRHGLLSEVAVAASLYPLATVLLARAILRERVRRLQELGVAAAITGVVLIAAG